MLGLNGEAGTVYCLDFGLAKLYRDRRTLRHLPKREGSLAGTPRCVTVCVLRSICVHLCTYLYVHIYADGGDCFDLRSEFILSCPSIINNILLIYSDLYLTTLNCITLSPIRFPSYFFYYISYHFLSSWFNFLFLFLDMHQSTITWAWLRAVETILSQSPICWYIFVKVHGAGIFEHIF